MIIIITCAKYAWKFPGDDLHEMVVLRSAVSGFAVADSGLQGREGFFSKQPGGFGESAVCFPGGFPGGGQLGAGFGNPEIGGRPGGAGAGEAQRVSL